MENCKACERCHKEATVFYTFYEINKQDERHEFGSFCSECAKELIDELKGKLEWIRFEYCWRGYIHPKARMELEKSGFIQAKHNTQLIEIAERKRNPDSKKEVLEVLRLKYASGLISREEYEKQLMEVREKP